MKRRWGLGILIFSMLLCVMILPVRADAADPTVTYISAVYTGEAIEIGGAIPRDKISVTASFSDNTTAEVTDFAMSTERVLTDGMNKVMIIYRGKVTEVYVLGKKPSSLYAVYNGEMLSVGNKVGAASLTVNLYYTDGSMEEIYDYRIVNPVITSSNSQKVQITYNNLQTEVYVYTQPAKTVSMLSEKLPFMEGAEFSPDVSRVLDSKQVSDHHAIIPTMELAKADLAALPESERNILTLAGARLLFAAAEPHTYEVVTAVFSCAGGEFTAKGKAVLCMGWKDLERRYRATLKKKPDTDDEENALALDAPPFAEGQSFDRPAVKVTAHDTTPPKQHTEASLLSAMERAGNEDTDPDAERRGLGTPATRAAVIEKLVKSGFVERKGKQLIPTGDGNGLVAVLPDVLTSPQLTAEWENTLTQIAKGKADADGFMRGIEAMARELVQAHPHISDADKARFKEDKPVIGKCPRCGGSVYEGRKNYYCENRDCAFTMWKNDCFFEERKTAFTPKIAAALLKDGKARVKKLYSPKTGKTYDGLVLLADTGGKYVNYRATVSRDRELTQQA